RQYRQSRYLVGRQDVQPPWTYPIPWGQSELLGFSNQSWLERITHIVFMGRISIWFGNCRNRGNKSLHIALGFFNGVTTKFFQHFLSNGYSSHSFGNHRGSRYSRHIRPLMMRFGGLSGADIHRLQRTRYGCNWLRCHSYTNGFSGGHPGFNSSSTLGGAGHVTFGSPNDRIVSSRSYTGGRFKTVPDLNALHCLDAH